LAADTASVSSGTGTGGGGACFSFLLLFFFFFLRGEEALLMLLVEQLELEVLKSELKKKAMFLFFINGRPIKIFTVYAKTKNINKQSKLVENLHNNYSFGHKRNRDLT